MIYYGVFFARFCLLFITCCCFNQVLSGALRGVGDAKAPMFIMIFSFVIFRQIYLFVATHIVNNIYVVGFGYPAGWIMCSALFMLYYRFSGWEKRVHV